LLRAAPTRYKSDGPLDSIPGSVPNLSHPPPGCKFHPRCPLAQAICRADPPPPLAPAGADAPSPSEFAPGWSPTRHRSACHFAQEVPKLP